MTCITIYERFWTDPRLARLQKRIGHHAAIGIVIQLWRDGLFNHKTGGVLAPDYFKGLDYWKDLLECEFVKERQSGFYVKGTKRAIEDFQRETTAKSRAGKKSAEARKAKYGTSVPLNAVNRTEQPSNSDRTVFEQRSVTKRVESTPKVKENTEKRIAHLVATYAACFKKRYKANPAVTGKDIGILKALNKNIGTERLAGLIQVYLQMSDPWFEKKRHDIYTFNTSIQKIVVASQTGVDPDKKEDMFSFFDKYKKEVQPL